jgi:AmmeMemoRadiSam system protein A
MLPAEQQRLLEIAREAVNAASEGRRHRPPPESAPELLELRAAFVTLRKAGDLRGCIGSTVARYPLYRAVAESAFSAAREDPRFPPVEAAELPEITIEISVLSRFTDIRPEDIVVGTHGLMVSKGASRGLLLPQVAVDRHLTAEQFLEMTCRKAGLPKDAWRHGVKIQAFTAHHFTSVTSFQLDLPGKLLRKPS